MRVLRDSYLKGSRFDDLEELYTQQKDLEGLAEVLSTAADRHKDPSEKLDLSYRTQLKGWQFVFVQDHVSPAELPVEMNAFKSQQHRWAKGSIQTFLKLMPRILQSNQPFHVKAEAFFHLSANFNYPLMCVLSVLMAPSMVIRYNMGWYEMLLIDIPLFLAATASVANFYMVCQRELYPQTWMERLRYLPFLMSIGIGLAVNNTKAVLEALFNKPSEFARTPKYHIESGGDDLIKAMRREGLPVQKVQQSSILDDVAETLKYQDRQAMLAAIGEHHVSAASVAERVRRQLQDIDPTREEQLPVTVREPRRRRRAGANHSGVHVEGLDDVMVRLSRCCTPVSSHCDATASSLLYRAGRSGPSAMRAAPVSVAKSSSSAGFCSAA